MDGGLIFDSRINCPTPHCGGEDDCSELGGDKKKEAHIPYSKLDK